MYFWKINLKIREKKWGGGGKLRKQTTSDFSLKIIVSLLQPPPKTLYVGKQIQFLLRLNHCTCG